MSLLVKPEALAEALFGTAANYADAKEGLLALYAEVDATVARTTAGLSLPCHAGCDACCHEAVFITPLEFAVAYEYLATQRHDAGLQTMVDAGAALYAQHQSTIDAFNGPPPEGARDHTALAMTLRFRCPLLSANGECGIYPVRELYARLFGASFNNEGGIYGCHLVGDALVGQHLTLLDARATAQRLSTLPNAAKRQVFPYYFAALLQF